jgi:uncharacterized protein (DUF1015 family)
LSLINPFKALRPIQKLAHKISTPNPKYFKSLQSYPKFGYLKILTSKNLIKSKKYFKSMKNKKLITIERKDCYYIYKISNKNHQQIGILGKVNLNKYDNKNILGHEETFKNRVSERKKQILNISTQVGPIYTAYKYNNYIQNFLNKITKSKPIYSFKSLDKYHHQVWIVERENLKTLKKLIKKINKIYICDGHHRIQGMIKSNKKISPMVIAFPHNQIKILDYNRVLKSKLSNEKIINVISKNFDIKKIKYNYKNLKKGYLEMYLNNQWYSLKQKKKNNKLDVTILHENIISKINAIKIEFISGINDSNFLKKLVNSKKFNIAFRLCPTNISSVMRIADKKKFMPPKSTWFHPKPLDGLICSEL